MATTGYEARGEAVNAALHGLIQRLPNPSPVVKQCAPVYHDLQLPTGQRSPTLGSVCQHCQLCLVCILHRAVSKLVMLISDGIDEIDGG